MDEEKTQHIKMDFSLETPEERVEKTKEIIKNTPQENLKSDYLIKLADYILLADKKNKEILTDNQMITVRKRETSFEGLAGKLENGEDGIYHIITNDKNIIFSPKVEITQKDLKEIPELKVLRETIDKLEEEAKTATGQKKFKLKQQIIDLRKDQYSIKNSFKKPIYFKNAIPTVSKIDFSEEVWIEQNKIKHEGSLNIFDPKHISLLLCNYVKLKENTWSDLSNDIRWTIIDLETYVDKALKNKYPLYYDLLIYKIDGCSNLEIQDLLFKTYNIRHSVEYISSLWRNKIPKLIANQVENDWLEWYYTTKEKGQWKRCSCCGQIKLGHNKFFSKNSTSKDGWYSICKECRNKKYQENKQKKVKK